MRGSEFGTYNLDYCKDAVFSCLNSGTVNFMYIQWNCSIADTIGPKKKESVLIREVSLISEVGLYTRVYYWDLRNCPDQIRETSLLFSEVSFKRGSTVFHNQRDTFSLATKEEIDDSGTSEIRTPLL